MKRATRIRLRVAASCCVVGAVTSIALTAPRATATSGERGSGTRPAPGARASLWSARRVPVLFAPPITGAQLTRSLTRALTPYDACATVDTADGAKVRIAADRALAPASTLKLLIATAALATFGPEHRFTTRVMTDATPGELVIVGGGDPLLATGTYERQLRAQPRWRAAPVTRIERLADAIAAGGVVRVQAIVVDDSRHEAVRYLPAWKKYYGRDGEVGALGALSVDGGFADPVARTPAADPAILAGQRLAAALAARDITVAGGVRRGRAPAGARELAHLDSLPLATIVREMLTASDNNTAETLLREIGVARVHEGTTEAGARGTLAALAQLHVPTHDLLLYDGSGLAPADRVTCEALTSVLALAPRARFRAIDRGLPIAGSTGTLAVRFVGDPLAGKLRAKTGSLNNVVGLAGVIDIATRPRFALLVSGGFTDGGGRELQADVAHLVAAAPSAEEAALLIPRP